MSWGLWVHACDVAKEGVPALLDEVSNAGKACITIYWMVVPTGIYWMTD